MLADVDPLECALHHVGGVEPLCLLILSSASKIPLRFWDTRHRYDLLSGPTRRGSVALLTKY